MRYLEFKQITKDFPIISMGQLGSMVASEQALRNQASRWARQGLILRLKKDLYVLNDLDRKITPSRVFIANQLYSPSYVSTEYALAFYELIPERVEDITCVTTKKTACFRNTFGSFVYQHINARCFMGLAGLKDENGLNFFIATKEKAVVDFLYLNLARFRRNEPQVFESAFRFQNLSGLSKRAMLDFAKDFNNLKLADIVADFCKLIRRG